MPTLGSKLEAVERVASSKLCVLNSRYIFTVVIKTEHKVMTVDCGGSGSSARIDAPISLTVEQTS